MSAIAELRADARLSSGECVRCRSCGIKLWHWASKPGERAAGSVKGVAGQCQACRYGGGRPRAHRSSYFPSVARLRSRGLSNGEVAHALGFSRRTIERWVRQMKLEEVVG